MSSFTKAKYSPLPDGRHWTVDPPGFDYEIGKEGSGKKIHIPEGFKTDFASVPRIFWSYIPPWGKYGPASVLHDFLYMRQLYSRGKSDKIFLEAMKVLKVSWIKRRLIYGGVRMGGWVAWRSHKKRNKNSKN